MSEFKRLHKAPRAAMRGSLFELTPRAQWLYDRSLERYLRRPDAYGPGEHLLKGEIGRIEGFRFVLSSTL